MKALLVIAHGSRLQASNDEVKALVSRLGLAVEGRFELTKSAYLELAKPDISTGVDELIAAGATHIYALPYFLNKGAHVTQDIPAEILVKQQEYPNHSLILLPYIGSSDYMLKSLLSIINKFTGTPTQNKADPIIF